jgi:hypothetical protein
MSCKLKKNKVGKIVGVLDQNGNKSNLFQQIFNVPTLTLTEAIDTYKNIYSDKFKTEVEETPVLEQPPVIEQEVQVSEAKVEIKAPTFLKASQLRKASSSERMLELKEKQDELVKKWEELNNLNSCLWN